MQGAQKLVPQDQKKIQKRGEEKPKKKSSQGGREMEAESPG